MSNQKGVTLIELLIVLVISVIVIGGVYKVFINQTRAYTVQDQVAEVQQDVRGAMEIMVRDIRMAGFQTNTFAVTNPAGSGLITTGGIVVNPANNSSITLNYQYIPPTDPTCGTPNCVEYNVQYILVNAVSSACPNPPCLQRTCTSTPLVATVPQCSGNQDILLTNVTTLNFGYGIDANDDGIIDGIVDGVIPKAAFVSGASVGTANVLAVQVTLAAKPTPADPDVKTMVSPRTLTSVVTPRNIFFKRNQWK